ncbi:MAG: PEP/pyruvate-binding domain-containing protein, partial [Gammaproteobacteria bacterium]|nr:PEP/pyruvate-binding domain-containing protein [Gammaproteobacteria bacterium]
MNRSALRILPLDTTDASLEVVGGKGRSLARMAAAGLPIPAGFHLTTSAYQRFVAENNMQATILEFAAQATGQNAASFELASANIQTLFEKATLSAVIFPRNTGHRVKNYTMIH